MMPELARKGLLVKGRGETLAEEWWLVERRAVKASGYLQPAGEPQTCKTTCVLKAPADLEPGTEQKRPIRPHTGKKC